MTPQLEPDELKKLIELAYLGEWMINAHHDTDFQDEAATNAMQRLLAESGVEGVERDVETGQYYLTSEWTDRLFDQHILDYDDHVFWDEITERLAQRDLAKQRDVSVDQVSRDEDIHELRPLEERYRREFEEHGVERLELRDDF